MIVPKVINLYDEGAQGVGFPEIKQFVAGQFGRIPLRLIKLKEKVVLTNGLLFDFIGTQEAFLKICKGNPQEACHIVLTPKIFATLDADTRPHIRAAVYGFPSVISTSGIVEGPAKPRQYYFYKRRYASVGIWDTQAEKMKSRFKGRFIDYGDKRLTGVLKGYIAQAIFFYIYGEPFCKNKGCRLFNAHWQEDLIYSQLKIAAFCKKHQALLKAIRSQLKAG